MSIRKDVIKQCLISKQREVDEAVIVNRPVEFEENGNYVRQQEKDGMRFCLWTLRMSVWRNSRRKTSTVCWKPI